MYSYMIYLYSCLFLAQKNLYMNMYVLNQLETNYGKFLVQCSMLGVHAVIIFMYFNYDIPYII